MTFEEFDSAFREFTIAFNRLPDDEQTQVYFSLLKYYDSYVIGQVLRDAMVEDKFFPVVGELVSRVKEKQKPRPIECEYCNGSGFEIVYSTFQVVENTHKCGQGVSKEEYEKDPINHRMFAARCRCRPQLPATTQEQKSLPAKSVLKVLSLCLISIWLK